MMPFICAAYMFLCILEAWQPIRECGDLPQALLDEADPAAQVARAEVKEISAQQMEQEGTEAASMEGGLMPLKAVATPARAASAVPQVAKDRHLQSSIHAYIGVYRYL